MRPAGRWATGGRGGRGGSRGGGRGSRGRPAAAMPASLAALQQQQLEADARQRNAGPLRLALLIWALVIILQGEPSPGKPRGSGRHKLRGNNLALARNSSDDANIHAENEMGNKGLAEGSYAEGKYSTRKSSSRAARRGREGAENNESEDEDDLGPFAAFEQILNDRRNALGDVIATFGKAEEALKFPKNLSGTLTGEYYLEAEAMGFDFGFTSDDDDAFRGQGEEASLYEKTKRQDDGTEDNNDHLLWLRDQQRIISNSKQFLHVHSATEVLDNFTQPEKGIQFRSNKGEFVLRLEFVKTKIEGLQYVSGTVSIVVGATHSIRDVYTYVAGYYIENTGELTLLVNSPAYPNSHVGVDFRSHKSDAKLLLDSTKAQEDEAYHEMPSKPGSSSSEESGRLYADAENTETENTHTDHMREVILASLDSTDNKKPSDHNKKVEVGGVHNELEMKSSSKSTESLSETKSSSSAVQNKQQGASETVVSQGSSISSTTSPAKTRENDESLEAAPVSFDDKQGAQEVLDDIGTQTKESPSSLVSLPHAGSKDEDSGEEDAGLSQNQIKEQVRQEEGSSNSPTSKEQLALTPTVKHDAFLEMINMLDTTEEAKALLDGPRWSRLWDTELGVDKGRIQRKSRANTLYGAEPPCFLRMELFVHPVGSSTKDKDQVGNTLVLGSGTELRVTTVEGTVQSPNCPNPDFKVKMQTYGEDIGRLLTKATDFFSVDLPFTILGAVSLVTQYVHTRSLPRAAQVSLLTIGGLGLLDGCLALAYLSSGLLVEKLGSSAVLVALAKSLLVTFLEMRYLMTIWRGRHPQTAWDTWAEMERLQRRLSKRFQAAFVATIVILFIFLEFHRILWFIALSFWVPQIYCNIKFNSATQVHPFFIVATSLTQLLVPMYIYACPKNFLTLLVRSPTIGNSPVYASFLALWVILQVMVLFIQRCISPHAFIPARFLPPKYDYNRKIPERLRDTQCAICLLAVTGVDEEHMITPCNHLFHRDCLRVWINEKLECPTCRAALPPV